jgi:nucleotide-binding universal stress UspA family protein
MIELDSVLIATDFGESSDAALTYARDLARAFGATLRILHVTEDVSARPAAHFYPETYEALQTHIDEAARHRLQGLLLPDEREGLHVTSIVRAAPAVAEAIVAYAREAGVHAIVVGTHGRAPVSRLLMGSVAEKVVRTAPCPVLVVRDTRTFAVPDRVSA